MDYLYPYKKWRIEFICSPWAAVIAAGVLIHLQLFHMLVFLISWHPCAPMGTGWITGEMTKRKSWFIAAGYSMSSQLLNIQIFMSGREKSVSWAEDAKVVLLVCTFSSMKEDKCRGLEIKRRVKAARADSAHTGFSWGWKIGLIFFMAVHTVLSESGDQTNVGNTPMF